MPTWRAAARREILNKLSAVSESSSRFAKTEIELTLQCYGCPVMFGLAQPNESTCDRVF